MKIFIQWSLANPQDWHELEAADWANLPVKPEPTGGETIDDTPGWIFAINVQGKIFAGYDHYHVEQMLGFVRVTVWNDDSVDWPVGTRFAEVWDCYPLSPDATKNGAINTKFRVTKYDEDPVRLARGGRSADGVPFVRLPWVDFVTPKPKPSIRHGIWIGDALVPIHNQAQSLKAWWSKEWCDHLPVREVDEDGDLLPQRPQGRYVPSQFTRTWYWTTTNQAVGFTVADQEKALAGSPGSGTITVSLAADANDFVGLALSTPSGEPNVSTWPTGNYRCQMDISSIGTGNLNTGTIGSYPDNEACYLLRISSDLSTVVDSANVDVPPGYAGNDVTVTGISIVDVASWSPGGSTASDRYGFWADFDNTNMMTATTVVFTCDADAFLDGPWTAGPAGAPPPRMNPIMQHVMSGV